MINITLQGGLGNTLFQYALGRSLQERGREVTFNKRGVFADDGTPHALNQPKYGLDGLRTKVTIGDPVGQEISDDNMPFRPDIYNAKDNCTLNGHWQSERYFWDVPGLSEKLRQELKPKNIPQGDIVYQLRQENTVAVHVRRGDYTKLQDYHGLMTNEYYQQAYSRMFRENPYTNPQFFIFSDDPAWCRENLDGEVIETGDRFTDLYLMSLCHHAIIGNSTFGWWGAWLGGWRADRTVIAPRRWFTVQHLDSRDIIPERWILIGENILKKAVTTVGVGNREDVKKHGEEELIGQDFQKNITRFTSQMAANSADTKIITYRGVYPPNSPTHRENPYAFKIHAIEEARRLGYEKIIWADTSVIAIRSLEPLWNLLDKQGYWISKNGPNTCGEWTSDDCLKILELERYEAFKIPQIIGTAFGLDFSKEIARKFFAEYKRYSETDAFKGPWVNTSGEASSDDRVLGHRHDQTVASVIAYRLGMSLSQEPFAFMANEPEFPHFYAGCPLFIERNGKSLQEIKSLHPPYMQGVTERYVEPVGIVTKQIDDALLKARQESARLYRESKKGRR